MPTIGIEWVDKYHGFCEDLKNNKDNARGFSRNIDALVSFECGDDAAADEDFETSALGGQDATHADAVDLVYFSGHGTQFGAVFGISDRDNGFASPERIRLGAGRCKWVVFDACEVLMRDGDEIWYTRLRQSFVGLHYMFGFDTVASDSDDRGRKFAGRLNDRWTLRDAWIRACIETEDDDTRLAYVRARVDGDDSLNDHWIGKGDTSELPVEDKSLAFFYLRSHC
jgi:hypothetical protein